MPPNRSSWISLIWWSRFTTGWIHSLITFLNHVHLSILSIMFSVAQARISFIKGGEIPFHFKTGWVDKNPFTATNNDTPAQSAPQEGERRGLIHWRWCVPHLSLCLYLHWYLISLSFRCLPQQPALCVASGAQATSKGDQKYMDFLLTLIKCKFIICSKSWVVADLF